MDIVLLVVILFIVMGIENKLERLIGKMDKKDGP